MDVSEEQSRKAAVPIYVTELGSVMDVSKGHLEKASDGTVVGVATT